MNNNYSERVQNIISFIELLTIPSGTNEGGTFKLMQFQKDFINDVYGPVNKEGKRIVRRAILSMARKNGKTMLTAALVLVHLVGPERLRNSESYSCANDRDQASIVFRYACQLVRADEELSSMVKIVDSTKTMVYYEMGATYRAVSAEAGTKMGLNPSFWIFDELAQAKNRALYDAMDSAGAARSEPLAIVISTQSPDPQHILSQLIDDGLSKRDETIVCHLHTVPEEIEEGVFDDKSVFKMANPALDVFRSLDEMQSAADRAKRMPSFESSYRNLYLNQRIDAKSPLIPRAEWIGCHGEDDAAEIIPGEDIIFGLDLSGKTDLTALIGVSTGEKDKIKSWFWKPKESIEEHEKRDRVPYALWERQGFIKTTPGKSIQYSFIAQEIAEISKTYNIIGIAFDRYRIDDLRNAMDGIGLNSYIEKKDAQGNPIIESGGIRMVPWGQGFKDMTPAVEALENSVLDRHLVWGVEPVLTWNISNAMVIKDAAGNQKLDKSQVRFRIDGAVALSMCIGLKSRDRRGIPQRSIFEDMTVEQRIKMMSL